jgi:tRNA (adenine37-N6)-methyltransferase
MNVPELTLKPIGVIRTPFTDRGRAPRQPGVALQPGDGLITLYPGHNFEAALEDLAGFERIWLLFWFDRNKGWKPKVLPPRSRSREKRGVFATRSPHRPNPLGLSLVKLVEIKGRTLRVADVDLLDNTPLFDIKPYLPYTEAHPQAKAGWIDDVAAYEAGKSYTIEWSALAKKQSKWLREDFAIDLVSPAEEALRRDPTPHPYRRITQAREGFLQLAIKSWRLKFSVEAQSVRIDEVLSGYSPSAISTAQGEPLHDEAAHRAFHKEWSK